MSKQCKLYTLDEARELVDIPRKDWYKKMILVQTKEGFHHIKNGGGMLSRTHRHYEGSFMECDSMKECIAHIEQLERNRQSIVNQKNTREDTWLNNLSNKLHELECDDLISCLIAMKIAYRSCGQGASYDKTDKYVTGFFVTTFAGGKYDISYNKVMKGVQYNNFLEIVKVIYEDEKEKKQDQEDEYED